MTFPVSVLILSLGLFKDSNFKTSDLRFCCSSEVFGFLGFHGGPSEADLDKADPVSRPGDKGSR